MSRTTIRTEDQMSSIARRRALLATAAIVLATAASASLSLGLASAKTSHAGWPKIDRQQHNKLNETTPLIGVRNLHNELLGGHGDDTIVAGRIGDVLWGDAQPCCQPETQKDVIKGGAGKDFIYASHGTNIISSGGGADQIHAHFGRGSITCASAKATVFVSHTSRKVYKIKGCPRISYKTVGH
jgi:Ca2+-binding RTX toxin-like protein